MSQLEQLRHSLAHLLAAAVLELYPDAKPTIGPATSDGFYYDFEFAEPFSEKELPKIEKKMKELLKSWDAFDGKEVSEEEARESFKNNPYKLELINDIVADGQPITFYTSGTFTDLCRGGHIDSAKNISAKAFTLSRIAGVYWKSDETRPQLTRIYGLAFETPEALIAHKDRLKEAEKRDHRKLGKELDLFTFSDLVGPGLPLFTPKGTAMRDAIVQKIYGIQKRYGFKAVNIPHITKPDLYKMSGHWEKFGAELFKVKGADTDFVMKPMNCPHHTQIYASSPKSYKELPVRYMETTTCYRDEQSGELLGLSRVRSLTQDDGHVFCTPDQIKQEITNIVSVIKEFYTALGMWKEGEFWVSLSAHDPKTPEKYLGGEDVWNNAETALEEVAKENNLPYKKVVGEAAFYGPKLDFMFKDAIGREWQLGTAQLDFNMPTRFGLEYTDKDGLKKTPVMIHRAVAGSLERFMAVIIEHFAGVFPLWLSPVQVRVLPIDEAHIAFAEEITKELEAVGLRVELDSSNEGLGKKVRKSKQEKVPYFIVIGDKELETKTVGVESRDRGQLGQMTVSEFIESIKKEL
jgi:threonyl-tRNA synthetase